MRFASVVAVLVAACSSGSERAPSNSPSNKPADTAATGTNGANVAPSAESNGNRGGNGYVSLRYDSLPAGVTYRGGSVAGALDFAHVATPAGDMIWLDTIVAPAQRPPRKIVRAVLSLSPVAADERVFMASCDVNGRLDPMVVAIVVNEPNASRFTKIRQAWRANSATGRFDVIPVNGIVCEEA